MKANPQVKQLCIALQSLADMAGVCVADVQEAGYMTRAENLRAQVEGARKMLRKTLKK